MSGPANRSETIMAGAIQSGMLSEREFDAIVKALASTAKGRAFLREHIDRARPEENRNLLEAVRRIEASLSVVREQLLPESIAAELKRIADSLQHPVDDHAALRSRAVADLVRLAADLQLPTNEQE